MLAWRYLTTKTAFGIRQSNSLGLNLVQQVGRLPTLCSISLSRNCWNLYPLQQKHETCHTCGGLQVVFPHCNEASNLYTDLITIDRQMGWIVTSKSSVMCFIISWRLWGCRSTATSQPPAYNEAHYITSKNNQYWGWSATISTSKESGWKFCFIL